MRFSQLRWVQATAGLSVAASASLGWGLPVDTGASENPEANRWFYAGNDANDVEQHSLAYEQYRKAFDLDPRPYKFSGNLAVAAQAVGKHAEAANLALLTLAAIERQLARDERFESLHERFMGIHSEAADHAVRVNVRTEPADVHVTIDGRPDAIASRAIEQLQAVYLSPGKHVLRFSRQGYETAVLTVAGTARVPQEVDVQLIRIPDAPPPATKPAPLPPPPRPASEPRAGDPPALLWIAGGGVAALTLGAGIGFKISESTNEDSVQRLALELRDAGGETACGGGSLRADCTALDRTIDQATAAGRWSTVGFAAAGAVAVGTVLTAWLYPWKADPQQDRTTRLFPLVNADGGGLLLGSQF